MTEPIQISNSFDEPIRIIDAGELNVALPAKKTPHAFFAGERPIAARMVMVYEHPSLSSLSVRECASAYSAFTVLRCKHLVVPFLVYTILAHSYAANFLFGPLFSVYFFEFRVCLVVLYAILSSAFLSLLAVSVIIGFCVFSVFLSVFLDPLVMLCGGAFFANRIPLILAVLLPMETVEGKFLKTASALSRFGINFRRGHARVTSRVGLARCDQHLTPSLYLLSGGVRG